MCGSCDTPWEAPTTRRLKLSDLEANWYCTIIGTCLSMGELRRLAGKLGVTFAKGVPSDHDVHTGMIRLATQERTVAKAITKALDSKHVAMVRRFARAGTVEELEALWREAREKGEVAGACWALMAHPAATEPLRGTIFGEIHMLSHQVGAAARADLKRFHALERENAELEALVARQQERLRTEIGARDAAIRELKDRLEHEITECRKLAHAAHAAAEMAGLRALVEELRCQLAHEGEMRRSAEQAAREAEKRAREAEAERAALHGDLAEARAELAALEASLAGPAAIDGLGACDQSCGRPDLCGRCILYVGGRMGQVHHIRKLVEECNGVLVHHDGGFEENVGRLSGLLSQADAVMFPVDCVSHMAHDQLKRLCKRWEKPFVPVRRSGLGAFMHALKAVSATASSEAV
jgi:hypothetical protein